MDNQSSQRLLTAQDVTNTSDKPPYRKRDLNPRSQQSSGHRDRMYMTLLQIINTNFVLQILQLHYFVLCAKTVLTGFSSADVCRRVKG
jgi:hypothetical protein